MFWEVVERREETESTSRRREEKMLMLRVRGSVSVSVRWEDWVDIWDMCGLVWENKGC